MVRRREATAESLHSSGVDLVELAESPSRVREAALRRR